MVLGLLGSGFYYLQTIQHKNVLAANQASYDRIPTQAGKNNFIKQSDNLAQTVDPELIDLDSQVISCGGNIADLLSGAHPYGGSCVGAGGLLPNINGLYLGGQCCGALLDLDEYHANLKKLQAYKAMPNIPLDPMHTPITMAEMWISYNNKTKLNATEQKVYDDAYAMSKEKPCCCKCWHYFTNEGIAKQMIKDGVFNSKDIANFWDASDICGT